MTSKRNLVTHLEEIKRTYRPEFKLEAVRQLELARKPVKQIAFDLGVDTALLYQWRKRKMEGRLRLPSDPPQPKAPDDVIRQELLRLKRTIERVKKERDILKKAISYFASLER